METTVKEARCNTTEHTLRLTNITRQFSPLVQFVLNRRPCVSLEFIAFNITLILILRTGNLRYSIARNRGRVAQ
jgi:hypothetical protein